MNNILINQDSSIGIIGGADGPTAVFLAGQIDSAWNWINMFGIIIVVLVLVPNIIYAIKFRDIRNRCTNKMMNILEQIGRYACMLFMVLNISGEYGFTSVGTFLIYMLGNIVLLLVYWIIWMLYFVRQARWKSITLAVLPTLIFLLSGVTLFYVPLIISAVIFGVAHIYVTWKNVSNKI